MPEHTWSWTARRRFPSRTGAHRPHMDEILAELEQIGWSGSDLFGVQMALEESFTNAIRHGNCCDESKQVAIECKISPDRFWLRVADEGTGFRPEGVPDCTADAQLECPGGRGVALIKAYMTRVEYNECGNCVTMEKARSSPGKP
jgi:serine/threonine-protein kinase RsbW